MVNCRIQRGNTVHIHHLYSGANIQVYLTNLLLIKVFRIFFSYVDSGDPQQVDIELEDLSNINDAAPGGESSPPPTEGGGTTVASSMWTGIKAFFSLLRGVLGVLIKTALSSYDIVTDFITAMFYLTPGEKIHLTVEYSSSHLCHINLIVI